MSEVSRGGREINLKARTDNEKAIGLYSSLGFRKEGMVSREFFMNGKFYGCILMGLEIN